tara:strand:+ start:721 stop:966 length:246 start_codon:yes stop_codon:yes gene_type:complete
MGNMKWIYGMIIDGSYDRFRLSYIKCVLTNKTSFKFNKQTYVKSFAKSVVQYVDTNKLVEKYEQNVEDSIESNTEEIIIRK